MSANDNKPLSHTITFLRLAAVEMRRLAITGQWEAVDSAVLRHMADQCEAEADELEQSTD